MSRLLVADSFLVDAGRVRGLERHRDRFVSSCTALGEARAGAFWDEQIVRLPGFGRWFPRFELWEEDGVRRPAVQLRPAPPPGGRIRLAVHAGPDPRTRPRTKGPDLEVLGNLKAAAVGADEVLLVDADGVAVEAAYSALAWWEEDVLCFPPGDRAFLPSVTAALVRELAASRGVAVAEHARRPAELAESGEVWLLNALHGIRPVHAWGNGPIDPLPASPAADWQHALLALAHPIA